VTNHRQVRDIDTRIGERIREARRAQDMSQTLLAERLGITFQQVSQIREREQPR
jgi:transcriptional regulator with XRE-family HTH domain